MAVKNPSVGQIVLDDRSRRRRLITDVRDGRAFLRTLEPVPADGSWGAKLSPAGSLLRHTALTEPYTDGTGQFLYVHARAQCALEHCVIHNPSEHALSHRPTHWRFDRQIMERICEHGVGHPDPDGLRALLKINPGEGLHAGIHGCDGCCAETRTTGRAG